MLEASVDPTGQQTAMARWDEWEPIGTIETDRFCEVCGYNLRTQSVRREPTTAVLMTRCPECGRFHPAGDATSATRQWLQRFAGLALPMWMLFLIALILAIGLAEFGIFVGVIDELTRSQRGARVYRLVVRTNMRDYELFMGFVLTGCAALGYLTVFIASVCCSHWGRYWYYVLAVTLPGLVAAICAWFCFEELSRHGLETWAMGYAFLFMGVEMAAGLIGALTGRALGRSAVRVLVPPRWRGPLAFLWIVDGKELPVGKRE